MLKAAAPYPQAEPALSSAIKRGSWEHVAVRDAGWALWLLPGHGRRPVKSDQQAHNALKSNRTTQ